MLAFILRRLFQAALVMVTVAFIAFMLFQYVGDPVTFMLGQDATAEQVAATSAASAEAVTRVAAIEARPQPAPADGFKSGGTTLKLGGYVRLNTIASRWSDGDVPVGALAGSPRGSMPTSMPHWRSARNKPSRRRTLWPT